MCNGTSSAGDDRIGRDETSGRMCSSRCQDDALDTDLPIYEVVFDAGFCIRNLCSILVLHCRYIGGCCNYRWDSNLLCRSGFVKRLRTRTNQSRV